MDVIELESCPQKKSHIMYAILAAFMVAEFNPFYMENLLEVSENWQIKMMAKPKQPTQPNLHGGPVRLKHENSPSFSLHIQWLIITYSDLIIQIRRLPGETKSKKIYITPSTMGVDYITPNL